MNNKIRNHRYWETHKEIFWREFDKEDYDVRTTIMRAPHSRVAENFASKVYSLTDKELNLEVSE